MDNLTIFLRILQETLCKESRPRREAVPPARLPASAGSATSAEIRDSKGKAHSWQINQSQGLLPCKQDAVTI